MADGKYPAAVLLAYALAILLFSPAAATVGGPTVIQPLGWEPATNRLYFLNDYQDESGGSPDLIVYSIGKETLIAYQMPRQIEDADVEANFKKIYQSFIKRLKKRLRPFKRLPLTAVAISTREIESGTMPEDFYPYPIKYWKYEITFHEKNRKLYSLPFTCYVNPGLEVLGVYQVPNRSGGIVLIRYGGHWDEYGYTKDYLAIVPQERERRNRELDPFISIVKQIK